MLNAFHTSLLLLAALCLAAPALAQEPAVEPTVEAPRTQREAAGARVRQVERDGGRVLQAERMQRGGREVYRIKVLTPEGRVRVLEERRGREAPANRPERPEPRRDDRLDSARQSPMLRDRSRSRPPEATAPEPPRDAGNDRPRRGDDRPTRDN